MKTTVTVTQDCINEGVRGNNKCCPIALALKNEFPDIDVRHEALYRDQFAGYLPTDAIKFIHDFDNGALVEPIEFTIEWVEKYVLYADRELEYLK